MTTDVWTRYTLPDGGYGPATDTLLDREVTVAVVDSGAPDRLARRLRRLPAGAWLDVQDAYATAGGVVVVMPPTTGSLGQALGTGPALLALDELAAQLPATLELLTSQGLAPRSLNPDQVGLTGDGRAVLVPVEGPPAHPGAVAALLRSLDRPRAPLPARPAAGAAPVGSATAAEPAPPQEAEDARPVTSAARPAGPAVRVEQVRPEQARPDQARLPERTGSEQPGPEQPRPEQIRPQQTPADQARPEQTPAEQARPDQTPADQTRVRTTHVERAPGDPARVRPGSRRVARPDRVGAVRVVPPARSEAGAGYGRTVALGLLTAVAVFAVGFALTGGQDTTATPVPPAPSASAGVVPDAAAAPAAAAVPAVDRLGRVVEQLAVAPAASGAGGLELLRRLQQLQAATDAPQRTFLAAGALESVRAGRAAGRLEGPLVDEAEAVTADLARPAGLTDLIATARVDPAAFGPRAPAVVADLELLRGLTGEAARGVAADLLSIVRDGAARGEVTPAFRDLAEPVLAPMAALGGGR